MSNDKEMKQAEISSGLMPPMDDVVQWRLAEREDFKTYRAEHREVFYDEILRTCRSNRSALHVVTGIMPWIRVIADQEIRLRQLDELVSALTTTPPAPTPKPKRKRGRPKGSKNKPKKDERAEAEVNVYVKETKPVGEAAGQ